MNYLSKFRFIAKKRKCKNKKMARIFSSIIYQHNIYQHNNAALHTIKIWSRDFFKKKKKSFNINCLIFWLVKVFGILLNEKFIRNNTELKSVIFFNIIVKIIEKQLLIFTCLYKSWLDIFKNLFEQFCFEGKLQ